MKRLSKDKNNAMIFGVCAGLANYLGLDPSLVRLLTILGVIFSFSIIFWIYLLLAVVLPNDNQE
jgi:phage shock protein PspC (stress-responsive transcriptional regulator)